MRALFRRAVGTKEEDAAERYRELFEIALSEVVADAMRRADGAVYPGQVHQWATLAKDIAAAAYQAEQEWLLAGGWH